MTHTGDKARHAAFRGYDYVVPLSGFSGAEIALIKDASGSRFVRKASSVNSGNDALQKQAARQSALRERLAGFANVPDILGEGTVEGLYYFDMQFVPSRDANSFLIEASFNDIQGFAEGISGIMRQLSLSHHESAPKPDYEAFLNKVLEISERTGGAYESQLARLNMLFAELQKKEVLGRATYAHGDLTFENILIDTKGQYWLIDSIAPPIEHYWLDWSKIFQDCEGLWYRHRGKKHSAGVITWLRDYWLNCAREIAPNYVNHHNAFLALTFARILPYTKTSEDIDFVLQRVEHFGKAGLQTLRETS